MVIDEYLSGGSESSTRPSGGGGIVVSSRIRLARNIADFPFLAACSDQQRDEIEMTVRTGLDRSGQLQDLKVIDADQLEQLERRFLLQLQSLTAAPASPT